LQVAQAGTGRIGIVFDRANLIWNSNPRKHRVSQIRFWKGASLNSTHILVRSGASGDIACGLGQPLGVRDQGKAGAHRGSGGGRRVVPGMSAELAAKLADTRRRNCAIGCGGKIPGISFELKAGPRCEWNWNLSLQTRRNCVLDMKTTKVKVESDFVAGEEVLGAFEGEHCGRPGPCILFHAVPITLQNVIALAESDREGQTNQKK
jgi:hypothetical protein